MNLKKVTYHINFRRLTCSAVILISVISLSVFLANRFMPGMYNRTKKVVAYHDIKNKASEVNLEVKESPAPTQLPTPLATPIPSPSPVVTPSEQKTITPPETNSSNAPSNASTDSFRDFFKNSVFIGDSISEGISYFEYLDESNVVAKRGMNLYTAVYEMDNVVKVNPTNVFILFGANDIIEDISCNSFIDSYKTLINMIRQKLPNTKIYVQSVLPVTSATAQKYSSLSKARIDEFNAGLLNMSKEEKVGFLNIASILDNFGESMHEVDGIHFKTEFYPLWLSYVKKQLVK